MLPFSVVIRLSPNNLSIESLHLTRCNRQHGYWQWRIGSILSCWWLWLFLHTVRTRGSQAGIFFIFVESGDESQTTSEIEIPKFFGKVIKCIDHRRGRFCSDCLWWLFLRICYPCKPGQNE